MPGNVTSGVTEPETGVFAAMFGAAEAAAVAEPPGLAELVVLVAGAVAIGGADVAVAWIDAAVAVGATPPPGGCPQICSKVIGWGTGALFGAPLPHFQPWTSPSPALSKLNARDEYTQPLPYSWVKKAQ
jgi:hypothetical protein